MACQANMCYFDKAKALMVKNIIKLQTTQQNNILLRVAEAEWLKQQKFMIFHSRGSRPQIKVPEEMVSGEGLLPILQKTVFTVGPL